MTIHFCEDNNIQMACRFNSEEQEIMDRMIENHDSENSQEDWHNTFPVIVKQISKIRLNIRARKDLKSSLKPFCEAHSSINYEIFN